MEFEINMKNLVSGLKDLPEVAFIKQVLEVLDIEELYQLRMLRNALGAGY